MFAPDDLVHAVVTRLIQDGRDDGCISWEYSGRPFICHLVFTEALIQITSFMHKCLMGCVADLNVSISQYANNPFPSYSTLRYSCSGKLLSPATESAATLERKCSELGEQLEHEADIAFSVDDETLYLLINLPVMSIEFIDELDPVDMNELHTKFEDPVIVEELVRLFLDQSEHRLLEWHSAFDRRDIQEAHRIIHSFKGSAMNICAKPLARLSRELEIQLKINHTDQANEQIARIHSELNSVHQYIKANM